MELLVYGNKKTPNEFSSFGVEVRKEWYLIFGFCPCNGIIPGQG